MMTNSWSFMVPKKRGGVMELTLSTEEQELLSNVVERFHRELLNEIAHTDHREFKQGLVKDEKLLESLISRLRGTSVGSV
jgi:hypothetical protein